MSGGKILALIEQVITDGNQDGFFAEQDPVKFSVMFWGTIHGLLQFKKLEQTALGGQNHKEIYQYSVDKLIHSITKEGK